MRIIQYSYYLKLLALLEVYETKCPRMDQAEFVEYSIKGCIPQILLDPVLNFSSHVLSLSFKAKLIACKPV